MTEVALLMQGVVFFSLAAYLWRFDRFCCSYLVFLFVYCIFAELGYAYVPGLSSGIGAYFGADIITPAIWFNTLSMIAYGFTVVVVVSFIRGRFPTLVAVPREPRVARRVAMFFTFIIVLYVLGFLGLIYVNSSELSWYIAQDDELVGSSASLKILLLMFKFSVAVIVAIYALLRQGRLVVWRRLMLVLWICLLLGFVVCGVRLGNRTDFVALFLGVAFFELAFTKFRIVILVRAGVVFCGALAFLLLVEAARYSSDPVVVPLLDAVLAKDYFPPAHILFAAMAYEYLDPAGVVVSNFANSLFMLGVPYLQFDIMELFAPGVATRSSSYAFYVFSEGYIFSGWLGWIYNGLVLGFLVGVWRCLAKSGDAGFNAVLLALMACMLINLVRGQTSYFIKYLYTFVVPGALVYCSVAGRALVLRFGGR